MTERKIRVLLVDDEPNIIKMVSKRLETTGFDVLTLRDGQAVASTVERWHPDVILLDLMMPGMNGLDVCSILKKDARYREIPLIIFTAKGSEVAKQLCLEYGADAYVDKSQGSQALLDQIDALVGKVARQSS